VQQQQPRGNGGNDGRRPQGVRPDRGAGRNAGRNEGRRGAGRNGGQRGPQPNRSSQARSSRPARWDPRREPQYSEPKDHQQPHPNPNRPAPVIQHRQRKSLVGFVGSLLGRKKEEEKS
jgi:hypothetical protein